MKRRPSPQGGYTIIEVIIFLTVSSALMASAIYLFQGRIPRTQFTNSVNEFESKIQDITGNVVNGYYPTAAGEATCGATLKEQGKNEDCIFLGRMIQFAPGIDGCNTSTPDNEKCDKIMVYTVYGNRLFNLKPAYTLAQSLPTLATSGGAEASTINLGYGNHITKVLYKSGASQVSVSGVAFLQTFGTLVNASNAASGSQQVQMLVADGPIGLSTNPSVPSGFVAESTLKLRNGSTVTPATGIVVCMKSGSNQFATLTIGDNNGPLSTKAEILTASTWGSKGC